jgi:hypothetical protein
MVLHLIDEVVEVDLDSRPIYSYIMENGSFHYGYYNILFAELAPLVFDDRLNTVAKIILSNFFKLHGLTNKFIEGFSDPLIVIYKDEFLPYDEIASSQLSFKSIMLQTIARQESEAARYGFELKDLIYHDGSNTFIDDYKISEELLVEFMESITRESHRWEMIMKLLMSYPNIGPKSAIYAMPSTYTREMPWLPQDAFYRTRQQDYVQLARQESPPEESMVALGFAAENRMYIHSLSNGQSAKYDGSPFADLGQLVKKNIKQNWYAPFFP